MGKFGRTPAAFSAAIGALFATAAAACGGEEPAPQAPSPPSAPARSAAAPAPIETSPPPAPSKPALAEVIPLTLTAIDTAFNAHDAQQIGKSYTDDCVVSAYGEPEGERGREHVVKDLQGLFGTFGDARSAAMRRWFKGNVVVSEIAWAGTMTGEFMGIKASHRPVGQIRLHIMWFDDAGLVKEMHEYGDDAGITAQMTGKAGAPPVPMLPTNPAEEHVAKGTPEEDKLADWGKTFDEAFSKGDAGAPLAMMADDADAWLNFTGQPATKGKKALAKDLAGWFKTFPDQKWTTVNAWGIDGYAIVEHTMTATQKGSLGPLRASNKQVNGWHWVDVIQPAADAKAQHDWGYANLVELIQQTGAAKLRGENPASSAPMAAEAAKNNQNKNKKK